ncbi:MAG: efflux RND transporter permease subunit, partial [Oceanobacter sp.]
MNRPLNYGGSGGVIGWFLHNPVAANLLMLLVISLGVIQASSLRKEAFPSLEPNEVTVSISYNSGSAEQSEEGLAIKVEDALEDVIGIKSITSSSSNSGTTVTIERQSGYDLDTLLRDVRAAVDSISRLPTDAESPVVAKAQREEHSLWIQLYGDADRQTLQQLALRLKSDLLSKADISKVSESGWIDPMMIVEVDEGQLQAYGLSLSDVEDAINAGSSTSMTAVMQNKDLYLQLMASEQAYLKEDFARIPLVTTSSGEQLLLGDLASIQDTFDDSTATLARFQGQDSVALQVVATGQDDIADSVKAAKAVVAEWRDEDRLP